MTTTINGYGDVLNLSAASVAAAVYQPAGTAGAVATTVQSKLRESVSVKDFGAVGDGVVNDTAAIQAAINSMPAAGGKVFFPSGTYLVNTGITLKTRVTLEGAERNSTVIKAGGAGITVLGLSGSAYNMRIKHLSIDGNSQAAKGIAILGATNGSNAHHVIEDVIVSGCTTVQLHLQFIIYGVFKNVYAANGGANSVLCQDLFTSEFDDCVFYNGTTSTLKMERCSQVRFDNSNIYNDIAYTATELLLIDSGNGNRFINCTFEPQGTANVTSTVTMRDTLTGNMADNAFIGCRFIGIADTKTQDINIGSSGATYKTIIRDCQFIKPTSTSSIRLTSQAETEISGCVDLVTYDTPTYSNVTVTNSSGNPYYIYNRISSTTTQPTVYTEGTWTPTQGGGLTVVGSFSSSGTYTRIGRQVTVIGQINGSTSVSVVAGGLVCGGLPFAVGSTTPNACGSITNVTANATVIFTVGGTTGYASAAIAATASMYFTATYFV